MDSVTISRDEAKQTIVDHIESVQGCKATQLAGNGPLVMNLRGFDIPELCDELVKERRIMEIEYVLPSMPYRIKSFYLPSGTEIRLCLEVDAT